MDTIKMSQNMMTFFSESERDEDEDIKKYVDWTKEVNPKYGLIIKILESFETTSNEYESKIKEFL